MSPPTTRSRSSAKRNAEAQGRIREKNRKGKINNVRPKTGHAESKTTKKKRKPFGRYNGSREAEGGGKDSSFGSVTVTNATFPSNRSSIGSSISNRSVECEGENSQKDTVLGFTRPNSSCKNARVDPGHDNGRDITPVDNKQPVQHQYPCFESSAETTRKRLPREESVAMVQAKAQPTPTTAAKAQPTPTTATKARPTPTTAAKARPTPATAAKASSTGRSRVERKGIATPNPHNERLQRQRASSSAHPEKSRSAVETEEDKRFANEMHRQQQDPSHRPLSSGKSKGKSRLLGETASTPPGNTAKTPKKVRSRPGDIIEMAGPTPLPASSLKTPSKRRCRRVPTGAEVFEAQQQQNLSPPSSTTKKRMKSGSSRRNSLPQRCIISKETTETRPRKSSIGSGKVRVASRAVEDAVRNEAGDVIANESARICRNENLMEKKINADPASEESMQCSSDELSILSSFTSCLQERQRRAGTSDRRDGEDAVDDYHDDEYNKNNNKEKGGHERSIGSDIVKDLDLFAYRWERNMRTPRDVKKRTRQEGNNRQVCGNNNSHEEEKELRDLTTSTTAATTKSNTTATSSSSSFARFVGPVSKDILHQARNTSVDDENVMHALLNSGNGMEKDTKSSFAISPIGSMVGFDVGLTTSADESEITMQDDHTIVIEIMAQHGSIRWIQNGECIVEYERNLRREAEWSTGRCRGKETSQTLLLLQ